MNREELAQELENYKDEFLQGNCYDSLLNRAVAALREKPHCATCQCDKLNDEVNRRVPDNPNSRSWHRDG